MTTEAGGGLPQELRERIAYQAFKAVGNYPAVADWQALADAILAEIAAAGFVLVETERRGRVGLALWSLMEEDGWTDELVGLEPGDRAAIPGALTGDLDRPEGRE
jgi:hypothetical protein